MQPRKTRYIDLSLRPREVQHPSDRLPAEGRLGSSENTSAPRLFCFLACTGPLFIDKSYLTFEDLKIELRYGSVPSPVLKLTRKFQMSKWKEQKKKKKFTVRPAGLKISAKP
jgi:hypothetical protein